MSSSKKDKLLVNNMITDHLDYMIKADLDGVYFIADKPVMFWGGDYREAYTPQFPELLEEQDILDCLEALGFETQKVVFMKEFTYRSEFFPSRVLSIDITPARFTSRNGKLTVQVRYPPFRTIGG